MGYQKEEYLKEKQYYIDLYDRHTVEECRRIERIHKDSELPKGKADKASKEEIMAAHQAALRFILLFETGERYLNRESTIQEWIDRDTQKQRQYDEAVAPDDIFCLKCRNQMSVSSKHFHTESSTGRELVLFMYDCSNNCVPKRAFFENGIEWRSDPKMCPECNYEIKTIYKRLNNKIITTETCDRCGYTDKDELDLTPKKEPVDESYEQDRARFCLTEEQGKEYMRTKDNMERMKQFVDEWKEKEKNKDVYDEIAKLKKLTVVQVENLLAPELEKNGYTKLELATPEMNKDVIVSFTAREFRSDREEYNSKQELNKLIKELLLDTNWRLMSEGVNYRLGILQGRLRAYEREEDLKS